MIEERPWNFKSSGKMSREIFDSEHFGRVMAAVKNIDAQFLGHGVGPVRAFAGDESVHALGRRLFQIAARSARDHTDPFADFRSAGNHERRLAGRSMQSFREFS